MQNLTGCGTGNLEDRYKDTTYRDGACASQEWLLETIDNFLNPFMVLNRDMELGSPPCTDTSSHMNNNVENFVFSYQDQWHELPCPDGLHVRQNRSSHNNETFSPFPTILESQISEEEVRPCTTLHADENLSPIEDEFMLKIMDDLEHASQRAVKRRFGPAHHDFRIGATHETSHSEGRKIHGKKANVRKEVGIAVACSSITARNIPKYCVWKRSMNGVQCSTPADTPHRRMTEHSHYRYYSSSGRDTYDNRLKKGRNCVNLEDDLPEIDENGMDEKRKCRSKHGGNMPGITGKSLVAERQRRQKLNEKLYSLRSLVPYISKMDKASIVADAIHYLKDLKKRIHEVEECIAHLEACKDQVANGLSSSLKRQRVCNKHINKPISISHHIHKLDVKQVDRGLFQLEIHCKKSPDTLVQLVRALEALDLHIKNAITTSIGGKVLNTVMVQVDGENLCTKQLKDKTLDSITRFGFLLEDE